MSLTSALNNAQNIFNNVGKQSAVVSGNIANQSNPDYVRRQASITSTAGGSTVAKISRAQEDALMRQYLASTSQDSAQQALLGGLTDLKSILGGNSYETAPSTYLATFKNKLQAFRTSPSSTIAGQGAVSAAQDLANSLNKSSAAVQNVRKDADKKIATQVDSLNQLLADFKSANDAVKSAVSTGGDPNNALDQRDKALKQISAIIGVNSVDRGNGDLALYTSTGITLFETVPRTVSFQPTDTFTATIAGNGIFIDGVAVPAGSGSTTDGQGSLQALLQLRDDVAPKFQSQLDEIAKGLVTLFSETNGTVTKPGLFTWTKADGTPGDTPTATAGSSPVINGIAASITVNPAVITSKGGDPMKLRDGSINVGFNANTGNNSGFSDVLDKYLTALDAPVDFDPSASAQVGFDKTAGIDSNVSLMTYASNSVGWLEQYRSDATSASENTSASASRSKEAYSNETGVNLDEELTLLLDIEQSYKAATKILNVVDEMMKALLDTAG